MGCTALYWTVLGCTGLYWAALVSTGLYWSTGLDWALIGVGVVTGQVAQVVQVVRMISIDDMY